MRHGKGKASAFTLIELPAVRKGKRGAFALIELLVVIAIIVLLVAMLSPALRRTRELTRRAICATHLHQTQNANVARANNHRGELVAGKPVLRANTSGHFNVWTRSWSANAPDPWSDYGRYGMHGVLAKQEYTNARTFYCPSNILSDRGYKGDRNGWFQNESNIPSGQNLIHTSYVYNSTLGSETTLNVSKWHSPRLTDRGDTALLADWFGSHPPWAPYNVDAHHVDGYNIARLDGSTVFHDDPERVIFDLNGGEAYFSGKDNYKNFISWAWRIFSGIE